jgi:NitT/TauT family transport system substrate-binding protein
MKHYWRVIAILILLLCLWAGCQGTQSTAPETTGSSEEADQMLEKDTVRLGGLKGPTSMGLVQLLESAQAGTALNDYAFTMASTADGLNPLLVQGELDIAALPANLGAVLYNNTQGAVQVLAVNTLGVLYIVDTGDSVHSISDLKGMTLYATGKEATPEYTLRHILQSNGLDPDVDLTIEWKTEPTEVVAQLSQSGGIAMLPQPFVTVAQSNLPQLRIALDLTEEWNQLGNGSTLVTGITVVRTAFAQEHPEAVSRFLDEYRASVDFINNNVDEAAQLVEKYDIINANVAVKAIPYCNITALEGTEMEQALKGYLDVLYEQNPKSVGGTIPDDAFYYHR